MKSKKIPMRTCVVTRESIPKGELIRIVNNNSTVIVDPTGKLNGRGAYVKKDIDVINKAKKSKVLDRHLKTDVDSDIYDQLIDLIK